MRNPLKNLYRRVVAPVADILQAKNIGKIKIPLNRWNERSRNQLNCYAAPPSDGMTDFVNEWVSPRFARADSANRQPCIIFKPCIFYR
jgi:hypothetical protein